MKRSNKNSKINLNDLVRYRKGEMTGRERNVFEKELQKDAFASEAEEGFNNIFPEDISKDIGRLQNSVMQRTRRLRRNMFYRIAASVAVLMVISSVFIIVERNNQDSRLTQSNANEVFMEIQQGEVLTGKEDDETPAQKNRAASDDETHEQPAAPEQELSPEKSKKTESVGPVEDVAVKPDIIVSEPLAAISEKKAYSRSVPASAGRADAKVISPEDSLTKDISGVALDSEVMSLEEVVVVGYGIEKAEPDSEGNVTYTPPQPVNGKPAFNNYVKDNIQRPDSSDQRVVVVISFIVQTDGTIDNINIIRSPDKKYSDEAIRLLKAGPAWKPAEKDGEKIRDKSEVKIVFK
jgi:hypothetical protein